MIYLKRRDKMLSTMSEETSIELQKNNWDALDAHIESIFANLDELALVDSFESMLAVNIIRGKKLLVSHVLKYQAQNNKPMLYAAFSSMLNSEMEEFGEILTQEATVRFIDWYREKNKDGALTMLTFLAECFNYDMIHEIVILQFLHILLDNLEDVSVNMVIQLLRICGKRLLELSQRAHNMVFEKLREILRDNIVTQPTLCALESLLNLRRSDYREERSTRIEIPGFLQTPRSHAFMIDDQRIRRNSNSLSLFEFDSNFMETERIYEDWKNNVLQKFPSSDQESPATVIVKDMTSSEDLEFKKKIYLILKSSLSSDEAAHKIIKRKIPDQQKSRIVDVIIKSNCQEHTYSKFYGLLSEKLCATHKSWKPAFEQIFSENYQNCDELEPAQLRTLGHFWGHLMASDYLGFEVFKIVHLNEEETNAPRRILLKFILLELVAELGIDQLQARFREEYIQPFLRGLFPQRDASQIRYSINYFTAIGLGVFTEQMRTLLTIVQSNGKSLPYSSRSSSSTGDQAANEPHRRSKIRADTMNNGSRSRAPLRRARDRSVTPPRRRHRSRSP